MTSLVSHFRISLIATAVFVVLLGGLYPLAVWGIAQVAFPHQANGSLITKAGKVVGSELIGQPFAAPGYFHPRPSAAGSGYDATSSGGTNLGPTSDKWINGIHKQTADGKDDPANFDGVKDLVAAYRQENGLEAAIAVPADAVTRSASGLDPHISTANALLQAPRIAKARTIDVAKIRDLIAVRTTAPSLGILGEPGVNVLALNLALDDLK